MGATDRRRRALIGIAALALLLSSCGSGGDGGAPERSAAPEAGANEAELAAVALAAAHRELPPPPSTDGRLTVAVTHARGVRDPGLDAAVSTLRQRPDLHVVVVAPRVGDAGRTTTMSGDPAETVPGDVVDAVTAAVGRGADLVVIGVELAGAEGDDSSAAAARAAVSRGVAALQVTVEPADGADYAAAAMQLLEVLDHELGALGESRARALRLSIPSCQSGTLRGRIEVGHVVDDSPPAVPSDCLARDPGPGADEDEAFAAGYATLAELG